MKERKYKKIYILVFAIMFFFTGFFVSSNCYASSSSEGTPQLQADSSTYNIVNSDNFDSYFGLTEPLFLALCKLKNSLTGYNEREFSIHYFNDGFKAETPISDDGKKVKEDLTLGVLDLSFGKHSTYSFMKDGKQIDNLNGLNNIVFNNILTLKLDGNNINSIRKNNLSSFSNLENLSASANNINLFEFVSNSKLKFLDLHDNNLSDISLSSQNDLRELDLSFNKFSQLKDLDLNGKLVSLNLAFNNLISTPINDIEQVAGVKPIMLVQGLKSSYIAGQKIISFGEEVFPNITMTFRYSTFDGNKSEYSSLGEICHITTSVGNRSEIIVPAGKVELVFSSNGGVISPGLNDKFASFLSDTYFFKVPLKQPKYLATVDGKVVNSLVQEKDINISFSSDFDELIPNYDKVLQEAKLIVKKDGELINKSSYNHSNNGSVRLNANYVFDGVDGEGVSLFVVRENKLLLTIGIVLILSIFIITTVVIFVVRWLKEGGEIAPLSDREIGKLERKQRKEDGKKDYTYSYNNPKEKLKGKDKDSDDEVDLK